MDIGDGMGRGGTGGAGSASEGNIRPSVSIALCTCNGEDYLGDQLASFVSQTVLPDELIACDDASTDSTVEILEGFGKAASFPVRIYRNEQRLGPTKNFERATSLRSGDLVFFCDQDDVWLPQKVNTLLEALRSNPGADYVFSDALIVDETLRPMGYTMWESIGFTRGERRRFKRGRQLDVLLKHNVVTGATMAFRAGLKTTILPMPDESIHDEWIALVASAAGLQGVLIEEPLIKYRQHPQQLIGGRRAGVLEQAGQARLGRRQVVETRLHQEVVTYGQVLERLGSMGQLNEHRQRLLEAKIGHVRARQAILRRRRHARLFAVSKEILPMRYHRFSRGWKSAAGDLLL
jgi:hypothetical protein